MTPPLTTRESLAEVLGRHVFLGDRCTCGENYGEPMTHGQTRVQQHRGHQADAVLAAGILTDATALWTLIERLRAAGHGTSVYESAAEVGDMIAAALSPAQSERAEVES